MFQAGGSGVLAASAFRVVSTGRATLGSFSCHFWEVLGAKLGGVSVFRAVSIGRTVARCKIARLKASKRQENYRYGREIRLCFSVSNLQV